MRRREDGGTVARVVRDRSLKRLPPAGVTTLGAVAMFFAWPRLALLLLYAIPARATVVGIALLAKDRGWDTHYTKFGPMGGNATPPSRWSQCWPRRSASGFR